MAHIPVTRPQSTSSSSSSQPSRQQQHTPQPPPPPPHNTNNNNGSSSNTLKYYLYYTNEGFSRTSFELLKLRVENFFKRPMRIVVSNSWEYKSLVVKSVDRDWSYPDLSDETSETTKNAYDWDSVVLFNFPCDEIKGVLSVVKYMMINYINGDNLALTMSEYCFMKFINRQKTVCGTKFLENHQLLPDNVHDPMDLTMAEHLRMAQQRHKLLWENIKPINMLKTDTGDAPLYINAESFEELGEGGSSGTDNGNTTTTPFSSIVMFPCVFSMSLAALKNSIQQFYGHKRVNVLPITNEKLLKIFATLYEEEYLLALLFKNYRSLYFYIPDLFTLEGAQRNHFIDHELYYRARIMKGLKNKTMTVSYHRQKTNVLSHANDERNYDTILFSLINPFIYARFTSSGLDSSVKFIIL